MMNDWTSIRVFNQTNCEIMDVIPNSQYSIQVLTDEEDIHHTIPQDTIYVTTPASSMNRSICYRNKHTDLYKMYFLWFFIRSKNGTYYRP